MGYTGIGSWPGIERNGIGMARKKQQGYNGMVRSVQKMQERKTRVARIIAENLSDEAMSVLGRYSDKDLRWFAATFSGNVGMYASRLESIRQVFK